MARSFSPNAGSKIGPRLTKYSLKTSIACKVAAGAEDHADKDRRLKRVEHEGIDVEFGDIAENLAAERLPVCESISSDANEGSEPEYDVVEMDERDVRDQIGLERAIEIKENKEDDDRDDPNPELLLFGGIVRHIRHLSVHSLEDRKSFRRVVKTPCRRQFSR